MKPSERKARIEELLRVIQPLNDELGKLQCECMHVTDDYESAFHKGRNRYVEICTVCSLQRFIE